MNLKPSTWFWTQKIMFIVFLGIYLTMSLTPWYYDMGIKEAEEKGFKAIVVSKINDSENQEDADTEFERKYLNNGRFSSMDNLIVLGYLISLGYVYGLFLSSLKTALIVNVFPFLMLLIKTIGIRNLDEVYQMSVRNVIIWWLCLIVYYLVFYLNDKVVLTDIDVVRTDK